jgi:hypothetical protein
MHYHQSMVRWSRVGDEGEPPAAALAVDIGNRPPDQKLEKLCDMLHARFEPNGPDDEAADCVARFGQETQGVWAVIRSRPVSDEAALDWRIVYVSPSGRVSATSKSKGHGPYIEAITDFDRDNSPEVVVREMFSTDSAGGTRNQLSVWTLKRGQIRPYRPAEGLFITWLVDQDEDGVPELMLDPYGISVGSSMGWSEGLVDWSIIARADPSGAFVKMGPVPEAYARALCPEPPDPEHLIDDDPSCHARDAHCARLWGVEEAEIKSALDEACEGHRAGSMCDGSLRAWKKIAETEPPFVLTNP